MNRPRIIFITGTDTGVGKTLLASLLLAHLRRRGIRALALKPFCSGSRSDVRLLRSLMDGELTADEINPFYFPEPVAPLVAARKHRRRITLPEVLSHIQAMQQRLVSDPNAIESALRITSYGSRIPHPASLPTLLIEGAGGLLAPLAQDCTALDVIHSLCCEAVIVASNKLGTINHTLLTVRSLQHGTSRSTLHAPRSTKVVLRGCPSPDLSAASNARVLSELLAPIQVSTLPFLGPCHTLKAIRTHAQMLNRKLSSVVKAF